MKINIQILYSAFCDAVKLKKISGSQDSRNNFPNLSENIQVLMAACRSLLCFHRKKLYALKKNEYIVKFEFKILYVQFRNDPVCRRKVFWSESDEVTKSDVCITLRMLAC